MTPTRDRVIVKSKSKVKGQSTSKTLLSLNVIYDNTIHHYTDCNIKSVPTTIHIRILCFAISKEVPTNKGPKKSLFPSGHHSACFKENCLPQEGFETSYGTYVNVIKSIKYYTVVFLSQISK